MGKFVREHYIEGYKFLSPEYNAKEVAVQTTDSDRTQDSARSQLEGIFAHKLSFPEVDPTFDLSITPQPIDWDIHVEGNNCERFKDVSASVANSPSNLRT